MTHSLLLEVAELWPIGCTSVTPVDVGDSASSLGVDPTQILQAAAAAEQDALLVAWQESGWNIFNAGFQALLTAAHDFTGLPW